MGGGATPTVTAMGRVEHIRSAAHTLSLATPIASAHAAGRGHVPKTDIPKVRQRMSPATPPELRDIGTWGQGFYSLGFRPTRYSN